MSNISFFHIGSNKRTATENVVNNIIQFYKPEVYLLGSDNALSFADFAIQKKINYVYYNKKLGGPQQPYGYEIDSVLEFLDRFREACYLSYSVNRIEHIMMAEDDVWLLKPVTVNPNWQMACHNITVGNELPPSLLDEIEQFSGKRPKNIHYGGGGGSIYNAKTFLEYYDDVTHWFRINGDRIIKEEYATFGWIDCFMVVYYYLCGKEYSINPHLTDTHNHAPGFDYDSFVANQPPEIEIINNYKRYYWNE